VFAGGGEVVGQRLAEEVHAGLEAEALAGFVEAGDDLGLHAQQQHLHVGGLAVGVAPADRAGLDAALPRLADLPDQVAPVARAGVAPDDLGVELLQLKGRELGELGLSVRRRGLRGSGLGLLVRAGRLGGLLLLGFEGLGDAA